MGIFDLLTEDELRAALRTQYATPDERNDDQWNLAVDCMENKQKAHTEHALKQRYKQRQSLSNGDKIEPLMLPIMDRYIVESATAYNKQVIRELVNDDGEVDQKATDAYRKMLDDVGWDEVMHSLDRHIVALDTSCIWPGAKRGELVGQVITPQHIHPVLPPESFDANPSDQRDYLGHVINLGKTGAKQTDPYRWVFVTPAAHYYYTSDTWSEVGNYEVRENTWTWPQVEETEDHKGSEKSLPLQMLTYWHRYLPVGKLIIPTDVPLATLNIELNVQWSLIMDTLRKQGSGQYVLKLLDPSKPPAMIAIGAGFMIPIEENESLESISHSNDYTGMVEVLKVLSKLFAILERQSPNDFAIDQKGPESGFAKLVDSLPKLEARDDRIVRLTAMEENYLWPRLGSIGIYLGKLDKSVEKLKQRTRFADVEFPKTVQERNQEQDQDIKLGISTPARILAKRDGISVEEAQTIIDENKAKQPEPEQKGEPNEPQSQADKDKPLIARLVARSTGNRKAAG